MQLSAYEPQKFIEQSILLILFDKTFPVAKRQDTTRSHPEHDRKDWLRWKYSAGDRTER